MSEVSVNTLLVPAPLRDRLGDAGSDSLVMMFAEANRIATERLERTVREVEERFDQRLNQKIADLRFDLLKWNFLFWVTQLAAITGILNVMLRAAR
jgi:hypothetical protein